MQKKLSSKKIVHQIGKKQNEFNSIFMRHIFKYSKKSWQLLTGLFKSRDRNHYSLLFFVFSLVTQLTASDPDLPPNAEPFKFKLLTGTPLFSLDEESGILLTKTSIDREQFDKFDLTIEVQDAGGLSSRSNLFIEVGDENDNPSKSRQVQVIIKNFEGTFPGNY